MTKYCACTVVSLLIYLTWIRSTVSLLQLMFQTMVYSDLLWSDPGREVQGWEMNDRGVSYTFCVDKVSEFLVKHDLDLVCRAHQVVEDGYEFFADRQLVTVFSAPNYCGEFDNAGTMMSVDETLTCSFQILKPVDTKSKFMMSTMI